MVLFVASEFIRRVRCGGASPSALYASAKCSGRQRPTAEVRAIFPSADRVGKLTVFNIGGNKARLIVAIHYNRRRVYIRAVLTHREYDERKWKE